MKTWVGGDLGTFLRYLGVLRHISRVFRNNPVVSLWQEYNNVQMLEPRHRVWYSSGGDKRPEALQANVFARSTRRQKLELVDTKLPRGKKYPVVIKKKGLVNTTRPQLIICCDHSITLYSKNISHQHNYLP
jgi:hypothetical protein